MSYILDALRRADAERERERGAVPGLHSMPVGSAAQSAPARPVAALWGGTALLVLALAWWWWPAAEAPALRDVASAPPLPPPPAAETGAGPSAATLPARPAAPVPAPPLDPPPTPAPTRDAAASPLPRPAAAQPRPAPAKPAPAPQPAPPASAAAPPRGDDKVLAFEQLPDDVKRAIPPLAVGGAIYSDNPASRLLMVGGQLLKEGDSVGAGVTLEQIRPRSAVLRWKDVRYEVRY